MPNTVKSILAIGDPHFKLDNIPEVDIFINRIKDIILERKPDLVIILGDLLHYHERVIISCLNRACKFVYDISLMVPVYVIVGNHDMESHLSFLSENHWMNCLKFMDGVTVVDKVVKDDNFNILLCPYVPPGRFLEALSTNLPFNDRILIFCHQEFYGCKMGAIISEIGDKWEENYPQIISGHIHDKQTPQRNIYYTGSSMQHAFGESSDKTIVMIIIEDNNFDINEIALNLPKKVILNKDIEEISSLNISKEDKVRININSTLSEFKAFKKTKEYSNLISKGVKIVHKQKKIENIPKESKQENFSSILYDIIKKENNPHLSQLYKELFE